MNHNRVEKDQSMLHVLFCGIFVSCTFMYNTCIVLVFTLAWGQKCLKVTENHYKGGLTMENKCKCYMLSSLRKLHLWSVFFLKKVICTETHIHHLPTTTTTKQNTGQTEACLFLGSLPPLAPRRGSSMVWCHVSLPYCFHSCGSRS